MDVDRSVTEAYKVWILSGGIGLVLFWRLLPKRLAVGLLVALTVVSTANYGRWGFDSTFSRIDPYDLAHYYLNSKYFDELGYYDLYPAMILVDHTNNGPYFEEGTFYLAQDEFGHIKQPIKHALMEGAQARMRFDPEDWKEFQHDVLYLQRKVRGFNDKLWRQMIQDHGYNGTPAWTTYASPFAKLVPVEWVKALCQIDLLLLLGAGGMAWWAYGSPAALWLWFFLMNCYSMRWPTLTWAFLRYDYLAALIMGMCMLKKGKPLWAGLFTGWSAASRLFPLMYLFGPGMKGLMGLARKKVHKQLLVLAAGTLIGAGIFEGAAAIWMGPEPVKVHFENMLDHNKAEQLSSRRIGLALALPYRGELEPKRIDNARKRKIEAQKPLRFGIAGGLMLVLGWALRRARDDEAYAFGFVPFFLLTTASYYYYVVRVTLALMHAGDLDRLRNRVGLAMLLGLDLFSNLAATHWGGHRVFQIGGLAWGICAYVVVMTLWFGWESLRAKDRDGSANGSTEVA